MSLLFSLAWVKEKALVGCSVLDGVRHINHSYMRSRI